MDDSQRFERALRNAKSGVIEEPRAFFDVITIPRDGTVAYSHPGVMRNGEAFPINVTHITACMFPALVDDPTTLVDERFIQNVGLTLRFHDQYYLSKTHTPIGTWVTEKTAACDRASMDANAWQFEKPFILAPKDNLQVRFSATSLVFSTQGDAFVAFDGVGLESQRPYRFGGTRTANLGTNAFVGIPSAGLRNDGVEPIAILGMTHGLYRASTYPSVYSYNINVRGVGKATNAWWFSGPNTPEFSYEDCPGALLGPSVGRAVVHKVPEGGFLWGPGDEVVAEMRQLATINDSKDARVMLGLIGHVAVV